MFQQGKRRTIAAWLGLQRSGIEALIHDHGRVAVAAAIAPGSFRQPVDLELGEVFHDRGPYRGCCAGVARDCP
jgi:hypothetical protein